MAPKANQPAPPDEVTPPEKKSLVSTTSIKIGYLNNSIVSDYFINTTTNVGYLKLSMKKLYLMESLSQNSWFGGELSYGAPINSVEQELDPYLKLSGVFYNKLYQNYLFGMISLDYESLNFVNLPVTGMGLQASNNNLLWGRFQLDYISQIMGERAIYSLIYAMPFLTQTDYDNLADGLQGSFMGVAIEWSNIYKIIGLKLELGTMNLSSTLKEPAFAGPRKIDKLVIKNNIIEISAVIDF